MSEETTKKIPYAMEEHHARRLVYAIKDLVEQMITAREDSRYHYEVMIAEEVLLKALKNPEAADE